MPFREAVKLFKEGYEGVDPTKDRERVDLFAGLSKLAEGLVALEDRLNKLDNAVRNLTIAVNRME